MLKKTNFCFALSMAGLLIASLLSLSHSAASAQGYPVVVPASSSGAASRAIVQINQADIYNNIANANNTANYAVAVGSGAQNTANWAVNIGSAAQGAADRAFAEASNAGVVTKAGTSFYQSGNDQQIWDFLCVKGKPPYDPHSGFPPFSDIFGCPAGSGPFVLSTRNNSDRP